MPPLFPAVSLRSAPIFATVRTIVRILSGWTVLALAIAAIPARAQMLSYTRGLMTTRDLHESSQAYQFEYRQGIRDGFGASIDYLNEGHVSGHHRDGYAFEASYHLPVLANRDLYLAASAGPYYYFDTQDGSTDVHGVAPIVSLTLYGQLGRKWFWNAMVTRINPTHDIKTNMAGIGLGYWLGDDGLKMNHELPGLLDSGPAPAESRDELTGFAVLSVINIATNPKSPGGSIEYRHRFQRHLEGTLTYIYEGDPRVARRSGVAAQLWPVRTAVWSQVEIGIGTGAYGFVDRRRVPPPGQKGSATAAGLISMMASYDLPHDWVARAIWDRVVTDYSRDADIWRVGIGHKL